MSHKKGTTIELVLPKNIMQAMLHSCLEGLADMMSLHLIARPVLRMDDELVGAYHSSLKCDFLTAESSINGNNMMINVSTAAIYTYIPHAMPWLSANAILIVPLGIKHSKPLKCQHSVMEYKLQHF
jgi:hypothetical protein